MNNSEPKHDTNGKAVRAYQIVEVQPNGERIKKSQFSPAEILAASEYCAQLNSEWNQVGVEYFVQTLRFA